MHRLGVAYAKGEGVPPDDGEAARWYRRAADKGFAEAQYDLGVRYRLGRGVPKDPALGLEYYRKAAAQGYADAIAELRRQSQRP